MKELSEENSRQGASALKGPLGDYAQGRGTAIARPASSVRPCPLMFQQVLHTTVVPIQNATDRNQPEAGIQRSSLGDSFWPDAVSVTLPSNVQTSWSTDWGRATSKDRTLFRRSRPLDVPRGGRATRFETKSGKPRRPGRCDRLLFNFLWLKVERSGVRPTLIQVF